MDSWLVLVVTLAYLSSLFAVAWWGDRWAATHKPHQQLGRRFGLFYALTLMIYMTSWSFYGSVGRAAISGFDFTAVYVGPILMLLLGRPTLRKTIAVAKAQNAISIADFLSARYGKSQMVAALVTIASLVAFLPYIALQLKAVGTTFDLLTGQGRATGLPPVWSDSALGVTLVLALFSILFGVRHIHASEHHRGLMLAIAFESVIKLLAFLVVALIIVLGIGGKVGGGLENLMSQALSNAATAPLLGTEFLGKAPFWTNTICAVVAFLCLPQMFHVIVVENENSDHIRTVTWIFPLYMLTMSLFMLPIAILGLGTLGGLVQPDSFMVTLPLHFGFPLGALLAFIGGMSAATSMVIVATVALSTMLCNDVVLPFLLGPRQSSLLAGRDLSRALLLIRRAAVVAILILAYLTYRLIDQSYSLVTIGLFSFVAVAQFGPVFFGGLYWRRGGRAGAVGGLSTGLAIWAYTLLLPAVFPVDSAPHWIGTGPFGLLWLRPHALFGLNDLDPISHSAIWSLSANLLSYLVLSLLIPQGRIERAQASAFVYSTPMPMEGFRQRGGRRISLGDLRELAARYVGGERAERDFAAWRSEREAATGKSLSETDQADWRAAHFTELLLSGAIGSASARVVIATALHGSAGLTRSAAMAMLDEASVAIQFNRDLLQATLENISQGVCVYDRDFKVATWNNRFIELLDLPIDLVRVGLPLHDLIRFNTERGEYQPDEFTHLLLKQDVEAIRWPFFFERRRPDGRVLDICFTRMGDNSFVVTYADVTERHRAQSALRHANERLEERVTERTLALQEAKAEAERANLSKTRFLAAASHDLLQPLNAARLFVSALGERLALPPTPTGRDKEMDLSANANAALRSVDQLLTGLLDISSLDSGSVHPELVDFPLTTLFTRLAAEFAPLARNKGLRLRVRQTDAIVHSDPQLLRRILQNFLSNALRYTREGGILAGCRRRGDLLSIEIWDNGPGISPDRIADAFQEFQRLGHDSGGEKGLGLGLAIVERIATILGHPIEVRSRVGRGSCFRVLVPLGKAAMAVPHQTEIPARQELLSRLSVLCIDNEPHILAGTRALLEGWECQVETALDEGEALAHLGSRTPDVVLVDYHLDQGRTGLAALATLREAWRRPIPALLITADRAEAVRDEALRAGCQILYKPVRPAALRAFLARIARSSPKDEEEIHIN